MDVRQLRKIFVKEEIFDLSAKGDGPENAIGGISNLGTYRGTGEKKQIDYRDMAGIMYGGRGGSTRTSQSEK